MPRSDEIETVTGIPVIDSSEYPGGTRHPHRWRSRAGLPTCRLAGAWCKDNAVTAEQLNSSIARSPCACGLLDAVGTSIARGATGALTAAPKFRRRPRFLRHRLIQIDSAVGTGVDLLYSIVSPPSVVHTQSRPSKRCFALGALYSSSQQHHESDGDQEYGRERAHKDTGRMCVDCRFSITHPDCNGQECKPSTDANPFCRHGLVRYVLSDSSRGIHANDASSARGPRL